MLYNGDNQPSLVRISPPKFINFEEFHDLQFLDFGFLFINFCGIS